MGTLLPYRNRYKVISCKGTPSFETGRVKIYLLRVGLLRMDFQINMGHFTYIYIYILSSAAFKQYINNNNTYYIWFLKTTQNYITQKCTHPLRWNNIIFCLRDRDRFSFHNQKSGPYRNISHNVPFFLFPTEVGNIIIF